MATKKQQELEQEIVEDLGKLNEVKTIVTVRENGSKRYQQDFSNCPTMAEQHTAHLTNINYLISKYKPDELAAYLAARTQYRQEIIGVDFSAEPNMQDAMNVVAQSRSTFDELPYELKTQFRNHLEFLKFIDNPANEQKLIRMGILKPEQLWKLKIPDPNTVKKSKDDDAGGGQGKKDDSDSGKK